MRLPLRQANGVQAYLVTLALFFLGWRTGVFSPARVYELFGEILSALNLFSLAFCCFLYAKARLALSIPTVEAVGQSGIQGAYHSESAHACIIVSHVCWFDKNALHMDFCFLWQDSICC